MILGRSKYVNVTVIHNRDCFDTQLNGVGVIFIVNDWKKKEEMNK